MVWYNKLKGLKFAVLRFFIAGGDDINEIEIQIYLNFQLKTLKDATIFYLSFKNLSRCKANCHATSILFSCILLFIEFKISFLEVKLEFSFL